MNNELEQHGALTGGGVGGRGLQPAPLSGNARNFKSVPWTLLCKHRLCQA